MSLFETAFAKINLALHVRERMPDGYHRIETIFAFCEDGDRLEGEAADALSLAITGPFAEGLGAGEDNLVVRAARALQAETGTTAGAALRLDKRLPVAAGLGGGSADAAAALRLLSKLWNLTIDSRTLCEVARGLGADVPACLFSKTARGDGRGDDLRTIEWSPFSGIPVLLANPRVPLSTAVVFAGWDWIDRGPMPDEATAGRNDLEASAIASCPQVGAVLRRLNDLEGVTIARMSGSGATCFALFEDEDARDAAHVQLAGLQPSWWRLASRLR